MVLVMAGPLDVGHHRTLQLEQKGHCWFEDDAGLLSGGLELGVESGLQTMPGFHSVSQVRDPGLDRCLTYSVVALCDPTELVDVRGVCKLELGVSQNQLSLISSNVKEKCTRGIKSLGHPREKPRVL